MKDIIIAAVGLVLLSLVVAGWAYYKESGVSMIPEGVACTADAKICPDGSSVGRVPPSCEFAACPAPNQYEGVAVKPRMCDADPDEGNGDEEYTRYYFESSIGACQAFIWSGSGGTVPFESVEECELSCIVRQ